MLVWLQFLGSLLQPPGCNILFFFLAFYYCLKSSKVITVLFLFLSIMFLYGLSIPIVSNKLISKLEAKYNFINVQDVMNNKQPQGILALAAMPDLDLSYNLVINQYIAKIYKNNPLPVLLSSYNLSLSDPNQKDPVISYLSQSLSSEFNITTPIWATNSNKNLKESARLIKEILTKNSINQVFLVTNAWHMPQVEHFFAKEGINTILVPIMTPIEELSSTYKLVDFIPNMKSLIYSRIFFKECLDMVLSKLMNMFEN